MPRWPDVKSGDEKFNQLSRVGGILATLINRILAWNGLCRQKTWLRRKPHGKQDSRSLLEVWSKRESLSYSLIQLHLSYAQLCQMIYYDFFNNLLISISLIIVIFFGSIIKLFSNLLPKYKSSLKTFKYSRFSFISSSLYIFSFPVLRWKGTFLILGLTKLD